jgi:hypothetical protein
VWLVGTSNGSIFAANAAVRLGRLSHRRRRSHNVGPGRGHVDGADRHTTGSGAGRA